LQALEKSFDVAGQSTAALRRNIIDIAHRNLGLGFDLAMGFAGASNLSDVVELQAAYWRKQFDAFTAQPDEAHKIGLYAAKPKTAERAPEPIRHETAKEIPRPQTPKKKHSPAARDPAERQRRNTQRLGAPRVAGSAVRPSDKRQSETRKAPEGEPVRQSLPAEIKFGMLDGNAVRFTCDEAWWLVDGAWHPISPDEVFLNAAEMREARFTQLFPQVPRLPSNAFKSDNSQD
jgi:hypothetical protein